MWQIDTVNTAKTNAWVNKYTKNSMEGVKYIHPFDGSPTSWKLYFREWCHIVSSLLIMQYDKKICHTFSKQISELEWHAKRPVDQNDYIDTCRLPMAAGPADENHWGHLLWLYCNSS